MWFEWFIVIYVHIGKEVLKQKSLVHTLELCPLEKNVLVIYLCFDLLFLLTMFSFSCLYRMNLHT